jgi:hypothetical protein
MTDHDLTELRKDLARKRRAGRASIVANTVVCGSLAALCVGMLVYAVAVL